MKEEEPTEGSYWSLYCTEFLSKLWKAKVNIEYDKDSCDELFTELYSVIKDYIGEDF